MRGVDINELDPKIKKIIVETQNSIYELIPKKGNVFIAKGGEYIPKPRKIKINGSTWGGSMIKTGWIGIEMYMELMLSQKMITTSCIKSITVYGDDWNYRID